MEFSIHQFSRGIVNLTQNQKGEWVSGGYGKEVDNESHPVPEEIKQAVQFDGWRGFGIPEAYPPQLGDFALIARDLGNYCVLAVANRLKDDAGGRQFVGYRYFWLDIRQFQNHATPQKVDGIGTLLWYWQEKGQPQYNIGEFQTNRSSYTTSWENLQQVYLYEHWQQQHSSRIQSLLSDIRLSQQPVIYEATDIGMELTWQEVHCLAIQDSRVNRRLINWAWNVRKLESSRDLNVIYCADAEACQWFNRQFSSRVETTPTPTELQGGFAKQPPANVSKEQAVQQCLGKFRGKFTSPDILELMDCYQEYRDNIFDFACQQDIHKFLNESNPKEFAIRYATLITALAPSQTQEILNKLIQLNEQRKKVAIQFLVNLKKEARGSDSCSKHPYFLIFCEALSCLQDELHKSLEQNGSILDTNFSDLLHSIRRLFPLIFFLTLLGGTVGFIYWEKPNIFSRLPWFHDSSSSENQGTDNSSPDNPASNSQTEFAAFLNMYEEIFDVIKGKEEPLGQSELFKSLSTTLQKSTKEILKILNDNQQLLTNLKSENSQAVQKARQKEIYNQLKLFTTLNPAKDRIKDLPNLSSENNENDPLSVTMLQKALKRGSYYLPGKEDTDEEGIFGQATKNAVINAQTKANFQPQERQGVVGPKTWEKILQYRIQDLQVEAVYQTLQKQLSQAHPTLNIVTEIKKCRDDNNAKKTPLHFNDCLEKIGASTAQSDGGASSGSQTTQD